MLVEFLEQNLLWSALTLRIFGRRVIFKQDKHVKDTQWVLKSRKWDLSSVEHHWASRPQSYLKELKQFCQEDANACINWKYCQRWSYKVYALGVLFITYLVDHLFLTCMHECYQSPLSTLGLIALLKGSTVLARGMFLAVNKPATFRYQPWALTTTSHPS